LSNTTFNLRTISTPELISTRHLLTSTRPSAVQSRKRVLYISTRTHTLDVQNIRRRLRGIWHAVRVSIVVVDRWRCHSSSIIPNQYWNVDVVDDVNRNRTCDGPRNTHVNSDLDGV